MRLVAMKNTLLVATGLLAGTAAAQNQAPITVDVYAATIKSTLTEPQSATVVLEGSDVDFDTLTYTVVSAPTNGTLSDPNNSDAAVTTGAIAGQTLTYTPNTNFTGTDTFAYKVNDGANDSTATIATISVFSSIRTQAKQIGADIDGEAANDNSASVALSSDGQILAVGAGSNDDNGSNAGHVRVYARNGLAWTQLGGDIDGEAEGDRSGASLALSGNGQILAVGASLNDGNGSNAGHVRVFSWNGSAWSQLGGDIDGEAADDRFGGSIDLSSDGQILAVGASRNDGNGTDAGHVRVYAWIDSAWSQLGSDIDGEAAGDRSGGSLALSSDGKMLAVGAIYSDHSKFNWVNTGHVRVYTWSGSAWAQLGTDIDGLEAFANFGGSVSLSSDGKTFAARTSRPDEGEVRVFNWNGSVWDQLNFGIRGEAAGDLFGASTALSSDGRTLAVGANGNDGNGSNAGHVRLYAPSGLYWLQSGGDIDGEAPGDLSGGSIAVSSDGRTLAVGASFNDGNGTDAGHVRVYELTVTAPIISGTPNHVALSGVGYQAFDDPATVETVDPTERLTVYDPDITDTITFSALTDGAALPAWLTVDSVTGAIGGTPGAGDTGLLANIALKASDGTLDSQLPAFDLTVLADIDGDGLADTCNANCIEAGFTEDPDDDNDGILDSDDAYPLISLVVDGETLPDANSNGAPDAVTPDCSEACISGLGMALDQTPIAVDVYAATLKNIASSPQSATVILEGSDSEFDALTYVVVSPPSNGTLSDPNNANAAVITGAISDQTLTYTPHADFTGTDTFTYKVSDGVSDSTTRIATISVFNGIRTQAKQIGADIDGEATDDVSGSSLAVSSDGKILAVGATRHKVFGSFDGHVRVYAWSGSTWSQLGDDIDAEGAVDFAGFSVALSSDGHTIAVGAIYNDGIGANAGHVRVYNWSGSAWIQQGGDIDGEAAGDQSGRSITLSSDGQVLAVGAMGNDGSGSNAGHVRVFAWSGSAWAQLGGDIDGEAPEDQSGSSIALSSDGQTIAVGAFRNDGNGSSAGHVRVFTWNGSIWNQLGDDIDGNAMDDWSGLSVALSSDGQTVAVGAPSWTGNGSSAGQVRVYTWNGTTWSLLGDNINGEAAGDNLGRSVALSSDGQTLAAGATGNDGNGTDAGQVRVYAWNGSA